MALEKKLSGQLAALEGLCGPRMAIRLLVGLLEGDLLCYVEPLKGLYEFI